MQKKKFFFFFLYFQYNEMKMQGLNKQPLRKTLLQAQEDNPRRTPRSDYPDQNARTTNEKNDKK
jgi:hypothetical protein